MNEFLCDNIAGNKVDGGFLPLLWEDPTCEYDL